MEDLSDKCSVSDVGGVDTRTHLEQGSLSGDETTEVLACGVESVVSMSDVSASLAGS